MDNIGNIVWVAHTSMGEDAAQIFFDAFCLNDDCNCQVVDNGDGQLLHIMAGVSDEV